MENTGIMKTCVNNGGIPMRIRLIVILVTFALPGSAEVFAENDWDLYMLRLVNRARLDPTGEDARIGSSTGENADPVNPLAYNLLVGDAANNHNDWMHDNLGSGFCSSQPDSFTHYETLDGTSGGTPATGTPSYTGAGVGSRVTYAGFTWGMAGENILAKWSSESIPINQDLIDANHKGWWESPGHRHNMLVADYTVFGHYADTRTVTGNPGVPSWTNSLHYASQEFARPLYTPYTHIFGLLYDDKDNTNDWTPREDGNPLKEGLNGISFQVFNAGTETEVASGTTMANGGFSVNIGNGTYDLVFTDESLPAGYYRLLDMTVSGSNFDAGDLDAFPDGDLNDNGYVDGGDLDILLADWGQYVPPADPRADPSDDLYVDGDDLDIVLADWGEGTPLGNPAPEPTTISILAIGALAMIRRWKTWKISGLR